MDTFEYIKTLARFREEFPEDIRPSWVSMTTITVVCKGALENIDLEHVRTVFRKLKTIKVVPKGSKTRNGFEWRMRYNSFMNQVTIGYTDMYSAKAVKLFPNGSIQIAGCSNILDCKRVIKQTELVMSFVFQKKLSLPYHKYRVVMINTNFSMNCRLNLYKLYEVFAANPKFEEAYEPAVAAQLIVKFVPQPGMKRITCSIFSTGNVIITGAETLMEIAHAYKVLNQTITREHRHKSDDDPQHHEVFMGAKFSEWLRVLK